MPARDPRLSPPEPAARPRDVLERFLAHRQVHPYGIADVAQLWAVSRWWVRDGGVVGVIDLPGTDAPVLYAVSADAADATLDLVSDLAPSLPARLAATGPVGLVARLRDGYTASRSDRYRKMHLARPDRLPPPDADVEILDRRDLDALEHLFATDPHAGDFFHPGLLDTGHYVGIRSSGLLVATAGIHVVDRHHGVAALGNIATHPAHRRRGLARAAVATLCHRLLSEATTIGLNVRQHNTAAAALYAGLGFEPSVAYEEADLVASQAP